MRILPRGEFWSLSPPNHEKTTEKKVEKKNIETTKPSIYSYYNLSSYNQSQISDKDVTESSIGDSNNVTESMFSASKYPLTDEDKKPSILEKHFKTRSSKADNESWTSQFINEMEAPVDNT